MARTPTSGTPRRGSRLKSLDNYTKVYTYNAPGWRVEKQVGTAYTEILYDASGEPLGENNRTTWSQSYVNFMGRHIAIYQNNATYFPHVNSLGSTTAVTDYTGAVVEDKLFYPWGQDWAMVGTLYEQRFAKLQHRDSETSLDPTPNRMFSSTQGRWLSPDPLFGSVANPQSLNRYAYVLNNACSATDASGLGPGDDGGDSGGGSCTVNPDGSIDCPPMSVSSTGVAPPVPTEGSDSNSDLMGPGSSIWDLLFGGNITPIGPIVAPGRIRRPPKRPLDPCANKVAVNFIKSHLADAQALANKLGVPPEFVLAVSEDESTYGTSDLVKFANNFFGLWAGAPGNVGTWTTGGGTGVSKFGGPDAFLSSGQSFVSIESATVSGVSDPTEFFTDLHAKFGLGFTTKAYVDKMASIASMTRRRMKCR